ncbi:hypothetical protein FLA105534_04937 [Flavobacterium bizetiae]|uniref:Uncharacterized protein n=1 Tax=Flavobacterium bizetiae TaxID=2704140 RepID=A0A6J4GY00_9FLAO|nr:hypothetical protein FLA105534_04937 [Flavobacterium bizetiae]CAD5351004.1 hypothetical protein FLA105534_05008 [Flavobacterium bizetiae]
MIEFSVSSIICALLNVANKIVTIGLFFMNKKVLNGFHLEKNVLLLC